MLRILLLRCIYTFLADPNAEVPDLIKRPVDDFPEWVFTSVDRNDQAVLDEDSIIGTFERVDG